MSTDNITDIADHRPHRGQGEEGVKTLTTEQIEHLQRVYGDTSSDYAIQGALLVPLLRMARTLSLMESGRGPDDTATCPARNGSQCCGWHDACRAALEKERKA